MRNDSRTHYRIWLMALVLGVFPLKPLLAQENPFGSNPEAATEGKQLYLKNGCYACHGHEAEGAVGPDLTDDEWIFAPSDRMIFNTISRGRKGTVMSPFANQMTPDEIWKVVEFLRHKNRERQAK